jgi:ferrous iron transport protein A
MLAWASAGNWPKPSSSNLSPSGVRRLDPVMPAATPQPLTSLLIGTKAKVAEIHVPPASKARLMEMGLVVGTPVELVRFAPLGDPVEIKVRGYHLTLRKHEAEQILVQP